MHTPGPWIASNGGLVRVFPRGSTTPICGVHLRGPDGDADNRRAVAEANARLITAAPDLLEALGDLISDVEMQMNNPSHHMPFSLPKAKAAIAKATTP